VRVGSLSFEGFDSLRRFEDCCIEGSAESNFCMFSVDIVTNGLSFWLIVWRVEGYVDSIWLDLSLAYLINNNQLDKFLNVVGCFLASSNYLSTYSNSCYC
jgi:hypothetical protein